MNTKQQEQLQEILSDVWCRETSADDAYGLIVDLFTAPVSTQEPVAWQNLHLPDEFYDHKLLDPSWYSHYRPLYTAPPSKPWVSLTAEEIWENQGLDDLVWGRNIEAALKERNT